MTHPTDILQYRELVGQLVLNAETMEELGRVDTLWMYPQRNRVLGVVCRPEGFPGRFGAKRLVSKLTQISAVGEGRLLMRGEPEPTVAAKVQQLESLIGQEVWSDRGERVGKLIDCLFNPENGVILRYLMTPGAWAAVTDGTYLLSPKQIISFSAKRTLIAAADLEALEIYQPGLRQRLAQIRDMLKEEYVDSVTRELRSLSSQMQDQVQGLARKAQGQMESLVLRTRERAQTLSEELSRDAQEVMTTIQTEARAVAERVEQAIPGEDERPSGPQTTAQAEAQTDWADDTDWDDEEWPDDIEDRSAGLDPSDPDASDPNPSDPSPSDPSPFESSSASADWDDGANEAPSGPQPEPAQKPAGLPQNAAGQGTTGQGKAVQGETATALDPSDAETNSAAIASDEASEPSSGPEPSLETDERDVWDDWEDDMPATSVPGESVFAGEQATEETSPDRPSATSRAEDDGDPWI
ncbi:MAG: hypothetical protein ACFB5Z_08960 [Elainellaceae cyanobacterium]